MRYLVSILFLAVAASLQANEPPALIVPGAEPQRLHGGFSFLEGPVSDAEGNLYFTDIPSNRVLRWSPSGELSTVIDDSNGGNGLAFDQQGKLIICEERGKRISMLTADGRRVSLVGEYRGAPFNSPNDLWVDGHNGIYFSDPNYKGADNLTQDGQHVYYLSADRQTITRVASDLSRPNGVITSASDDRLYVADTELDRIFVYPILAPGKLGPRQSFAATAADGITLDEQGNLYAAWRGEIRIYDPEGKVLHVISMPERPSNVTFGGVDNRTLFITARESLYSLQMAVEGRKPE